MTTVPIKTLMRRAMEREASDLHIVAGVPPSLRVDGEIVFIEGPPVTPEQSQELVYQLLTEEQKVRLQKERELEFSYSDPDLGRFRSAIYYERGFVEASFRVVPFKLRSLEELTLPNAVHDLAKRPGGLVLITGPTGQGKTTTMNAMIDLINASRRCRIITIEDPIEYMHPHKRSVVIQREVENDTLSFHRALIAALRQDPNVLCVGEMRDLETITTALTAAETGHLVISTLHTQTAAQTIDRIIDVFPAYQQAQVRMQLASSLQGVVCQQLLPRAGERGRVLAYEVLIATPAVRKIIRDGKIELLHNVIQTGREDGMVMMDRSIRDLYEKGLISYDTALSRCHDAETFKSLSTSR